VLDKNYLESSTVAVVLDDQLFSSWKLGKSEVLSSPTVPEDSVVKFAELDIPEEPVVGCRASILSFLFLLNLSIKTPPQLACAVNLKI
jgi:hypothetical protein